MTDTVNTKPHTDIKRLLWIEQILPAFLRPYAYLMRLDRPIGIWLLLLPGWWSIFLASGGFAKVTFWGWACLMLFWMGAIIMRGAGCVINDLWDRDLDKMVERTQSRPIASGQVTPRMAFAFLALLLLLGMLILLCFDRTTFILGLVTLPLIATYPLMKRITWWPQAFLGLTFNFGALMGWSAIHGGLSAAPFILYLGAIFWTIGYDTIYAHQDKEDDALAGIKSTARLFAGHSKKWIIGLYGAFLLCLGIVLAINGGNLIWLALPAAHMIWQIYIWNPDDHASSLRVFKSNRDLGFLVLLMFCFAF